MLLSSSPPLPCSAYIATTSHYMSPNLDFHLPEIVPSLLTILHYCRAFLVGSCVRLHLMVAVRLIYIYFCCCCVVPIITWQDDKTSPIHSNPRALICSSNSSNSSFLSSLPHTYLIVVYYDRATTICFQYI